MRLSTQQKGVTTELAVATYFLSLGYNVSSPFCQDSRYDLILDVCGKLLRLQVKTPRLSGNNSIILSCRSTTTNSKDNKSHTYSKTEVDFIATFWDGRAYLIPVGECVNSKRLYLLSPRQSNWSFIGDYLAEKVLKNL
jgi:hypothetical protein